MPTAVRLDFTPPSEPDMTLLHVEESANSDGPYNEVTGSPFAAGTYPDYISYKTVQATNPNDWFRVQWENSGGAKGPYSNSIQGGTETLVADITNRIMLRDPQINEKIATELAEATIEQYFHKDPYTVDVNTVKYAIKVGLTFVALASIYTITANTTSSADSWTAGLLSMKSGQNAAQSSANIQALEKQAAKWLGWSMSVVAHLAEVEIVRGLAEIVSADHSRLLVEVE